MEPSSLLVFVVAAAVGGYLQAFAGFSMGLVVIGAATALQLAPVPSIAAAANIMMLFNSGIILHRSRKSIDMDLVWCTLAGILPATVAGAVLLEVISSRFVLFSQLLLGGLVVTGGLALMVSPRPRPHRSSTLGFTVAGLVSGLLGGLFTIPAPPLVYHYYRQPMDVHRVRATLLVLFAALAMVRLVTVTLLGHLDANALRMSMLSLPAVLTAGWLAARFPPQLSDRTTRRGVFVLLTALGGIIVAMAARSA